MSYSPISGVAEHLGGLEEGSLAKALQVKDEKVKRLHGDIIETFEKRFKDGSLQDKDHMSIKDLLTAVSETTASNARQFREECGIEGDPDGQFKEPLNEEGIPELEERLGLLLPSDFKYFLSISNGLGPSWGGMSMEPALYESNDICWVYGESVSEIWVELLALPIFALGDDNESIDYKTWSKAEEVIEIGQEDVTCIWLVLPETVDRVRKAYFVLGKEIRKLGVVLMTVFDHSLAGWMNEFKNLEWCVPQVVDGSTEAWSSFRSFLESRLDDSIADMLQDERDGSFESSCLAYSCE